MSKIIFLGLLLVLVTQAAFMRNLHRNKRESPECPEDCASTPMEIAFVVDSSASIWPKDFTRCMVFIEDFVSLFKISPTAVRVSMITFGEVEYQDNAFGFADHEDLQSLTSAISNIPHRGGSRTNTAAGINFMLEQQMSQARDGVRRIAIVITDGKSQEKDETQKAAKAAHDANLEVFAIGVGKKASVPELHTIASDNRHVFMVASYDMLDGIKKRLAYQSCDVPTYPECEMDPVDLSFVIDSSVSIGRDNFTRGMDFVQHFVDSFEIGPSAVRVSAITFGYDFNEEDAFDFADHTDKKELLDRLSMIPWRHGNRTNTGAGIAYMRNNQMVNARDEAAHVCIVITDGKSQEGEITKEEAEKAKSQHIVMYAVGVGTLGQELDEQELNNIASSPQNVLTVTSYDKLNLIKDQLINVTCGGILASIEHKSGLHKSEYNPA